MTEQKFKIWDFIAGCMYEPFELVKCLSEGGAMSDHYIYPQFTGLVDRRGVEIYDYDILKYVNDNSGNSKIKGYVVFDKGGFRLKHTDKKISIESVNLGSLGRLNKYFEVVGNILENPELIESE